MCWLTFRFFFLLQIFLFHLKKQLIEINVKIVRKVTLAIYSIVTFGFRSICIELYEVNWSYIVRILINWWLWRTQFGKYKRIEIEIDMELVQTFLSVAKKVRASVWCVFSCNIVDCNIVDIYMNAYWYSKIAALIGQSLNLVALSLPPGPELLPVISTKYPRLMTVPNGAPYNNSQVVLDIIISFDILRLVVPRPMGNWISLSLGRCQGLSPRVSTLSTHEKNKKRGTNKSVEPRSSRARNCLPTKYSFVKWTEQLSQYFVSKLRRNNCFRSD